jgi:hypothetical protein
MTRLTGARSRTFLAVIAFGVAVVDTAVGATGHEPGDGRHELSGRQHSARPSVSDDGRWVVFEGPPPDGDVRSSTIWLVDRSEPVGSPPIELTPVDERIRPGDSVRPVISGDGCSVIVVTQLAYDLFRDDDAGDRWDVYRTPLPGCGGTAGDWELVSTASSVDGDVVALDRVLPDETPAVSWTGVVVVYGHRAPLDPRRLRQLSVADLTIAVGESGRTQAVPGLPVEEPANGFLHRGQFDAEVSADGRMVVFVSDARAMEAVPQWETGVIDRGPAITQVYRWDRLSTGNGDEIRLVSGLGNQPAPDGASEPAVSADGRFVVFVSSSRLSGVPVYWCTSTCPPQVHRWDAQDGNVELVSRQPAGDAVQGQGGAYEPLAAGAFAPDISADGEHVVFVTKDRTVLWPRAEVGAAPDEGDIVVTDLGRDTLARVSVRADGVTPLSATNSHPRMSSTGHVIVFDTLDESAAELWDGVPTALEGVRRVAVVGRPPVLTAAALDVGTVSVAVPGPEWYLAVRNQGPSVFVPSLVQSTDGQFEVTGGTCELGVPVQPGLACTVYVTFTPSAAGRVGAQIRVQDSAFGGASIGIDVVGVGGEPAFSAIPAGIEYDETMTGAATVAASVAFAPTDTGYRSAVMRIRGTSGAYVSVLLTGYGRRDAVVVTTEQEVRPGDDVVAIGVGFPVGAEVTVSWADGRGSSAIAAVQRDGTFGVTLKVRPSTRPGERQIIAAGNGVEATAVIEILRRRSSTPFGM